MPQKHRSPARATRATFAVLLVAVLLVAGLAAPTGARVASTDFVSIFEHPHPKIGTCS